MVQMLDIGKVGSLDVENGDIRPILWDCVPQFFDGMRQMNRRELPCQRRGERPCESGVALEDYNR